MTQDSSQRPKQYNSQRPRRLQNAPIKAFGISVLLISPLIALTIYLVSLVLHSTSEDRGATIWFLGIPAAITLSFLASILVFHYVSGRFVPWVSFLILGTLLPFTLALLMLPVSGLLISLTWTSIIGPIPDTIGQWMLVIATAWSLTMFFCTVLFLNTLPIDVKLQR